MSIWSPGSKKLTGRREIDCFLIKSNHIHLGEALGERVMLLAHSCGPRTVQAGGVGSGDREGANNRKYIEGEGGENT